MNGNVMTKLLATDGFIQVNKYLIKTLGLHEAILIGELVSEYNYWSSQDKLIDDMFYATRESIEDNTGLNAYMQRKAFSHLEELELITVVKQGMPAVNYYKLNFNNIINVLEHPEVVNDKCSKNSTTSGVNFKQQEVKNLHLNNNNNNNKQTKKSLSKDKLESTDSNVCFNFGNSSKKSSKQNLYTKCINLIDDFAKDNKELKDTLVDFLNMRLEMKDKPFYSNNLKGIIKKLATWQEQGIDIIPLINSSIENGWKSVYKPDNKKFSKYNSNQYVGKQIPKPTVKAERSGVKF